MFGISTLSILSSKMNTTVSVSIAGIPVTSGLTAQWESDSIVGLNDGDGITTWADLSGNGHDATQSSATLKPAYNTNIFGTKPSVKFDGVNDAFGIANTIALPNFTVFLVQLIGSVSPWVYQVANMQWGHAGIQGFALNGDGSLGGSFGAHITIHGTSSNELLNKKMNGISWATNTKHLIVWTYDGATVAARSDGADRTVSTNDSGFGYSPDEIGWSFQYTNGWIAAIIIYNRVLSGTEISSVETYLNTKYPCF